MENRDGWSGFEGREGCRREIVGKIAEKRGFWGGWGEEAGGMGGVFVEGEGVNRGLD